VILGTFSGIWALCGKSVTAFRTLDVYVGVFPAFFGAFRCITGKYSFIGRQEAREFGIGIIGDSNFISCQTLPPGAVATAPPRRARPLTQGLTVVQFLA